MRRIAPVCLALLLFVACRDDPPAPTPTPPQPGPEEPGTFLTEPAGVPPAALMPWQVELHLRAMLKPQQTRTRVAALTGVRDLWPAPGSVAPTLDMPTPRLRARFGAPAKVRQDELAGLLSLGVRGNLVLWYPVMEVRERLNDGRTGVWRGITRLREALPTDGARLGGTPVLYLGAVSALDLALLEGGAPDGWERVVRAADAPGQPDLFTAPDGQPIAYLVPRSGRVIEASFDAAVESLVPLVKQGGHAWLLIALPLAEERKPERL